METKRQRMVAKDIERVVAVYLSQEVAPMFPSVIISVVRSEISVDLRNINLYISILDIGGTGKEKIFRVIQNKAGNARQEVATKCKLKWAPMLNFVFDDGIEASYKIENTINQIKKK